MAVYISMFPPIGKAYDHDFRLTHYSGPSLVEKDKVEIVYKFRDTVSTKKVHSRALHSCELNKTPMPFSLQTPKNKASIHHDVAII